MNLNEFYLAFDKALETKPEGHKVVLLGLDEQIRVTTELGAHFECCPITYVEWSTRNFSCNPWKSCQYIHAGDQLEIPRRHMGNIANAADFLTFTADRLARKRIRNKLIGIVEKYDARRIP